MIRNAGWTVQQCWEQPAAEAFAFLAHLAEHPPEYIILAAVHGIGPKPKPAFDAESMTTLGSMLGPAQPMPQHVQDIIAWAESFGPPNHA